jgi:hypothetical protein
MFDAKTSDSATGTAYPEALGESAPVSPDCITMSSHARIEAAAGTARWTRHRRPLGPARDLGGQLPVLHVGEALDTAARGGVGGAMMFAGLVISLFVNAIFGAIGGLLGTSIFKASVPPPPPVPGFADSSRPHTPE